MKLLPSSLAALFAMLGTLTLHATDFSPQVIRQTIDGPNPRHYYFRSGERKIIFRIDPLTRIAGAGTNAEFTFTDAPAASLKISPSPTKSDVAFEKDAAAYEATARTLLPPNCTEVVADKPVADVFPINNWTSLQFSYTYNFYGKVFRSSVTFLNYSENEQWVLLVTEEPDQFGAVSQRVSRILNSMDERPMDYQSENAPS